MKIITIMLVAVLQACSSIPKAYTYGEVFAELEGPVLVAKYNNGRSEYSGIEWRLRGQSERVPLGVEGVKQRKQDRSACIQNLSSENPFAPGVIYGGYQVIECMKNRGWEPVLYGLTAVS